MVDRDGLPRRRPGGQARGGGQAGFRAVELFENDLTFFPGKARDARRIAADLGLEIVALQPLRDFEGASRPRSAPQFERAERKLELTHDSARRCSACAPASPRTRSAIPSAWRRIWPTRGSRAQHLISATRRWPGAATCGIGRRPGISCAQGGSRPISASCSTVSTSACAAIRWRRSRSAGRANRTGAGRRRTGLQHGPAVVQPALSLLSRPGRVARRRLSRSHGAQPDTRPGVTGDFQRAVSRRLGRLHRASTALRSLRSAREALSARGAATFAPLPRAPVVLAPEFLEFAASGKDVADFAGLFEGPGLDYAGAPSQQAGRASALNAASIW